MAARRAANTHILTHTYQTVSVYVCVFAVKGDNAQTSSQPSPSSSSSSLAHIENEGNEINQNSLNRRRSWENRNTAAATVIMSRARSLVCVWECTVCVCVWCVSVGQLCVSAFRLSQTAPKQS